MSRNGHAGILENGQPYAVIRTGEWFGDAEMVLTFPAGWEVDMRLMAGHAAPRLSDDQMRHALRNAIGTPRLAELAEGKQSVVITFDDLARPTPTAPIVPFIIEELQAAGIRDEQLFFQCSSGTHGPLSQPDMVQKLGADIVAAYPVWNHDCFHGHTCVGRTSRGNEVKLNNRFVAADLKICISGVKKHGMAGYGGGAKAVVPGLAAFETAGYVHHQIDHSCETADGFVNNEVRLDMEEAARLAGLDMSINLVMNGDRQIAGIFAGDVVAAHRAACRVAHATYTTQMAEGADVVICNAYPQSVEASKELHHAELSLRDGGTAVLVQDTPAGQRKMHFLGWSESDGGNRPRPSAPPVPQAAQTVVFNRTHAKWDEMEFAPEVRFARSWDHVLALLTELHGKGTQVAIYPTGALQHGPLRLRMESNPHAA